MTGACKSLTKSETFENTDRTSVLTIKSRFFGKSNRSSVTACNKEIIISVGQTVIYIVHRINHMT